MALTETKQIKEAWNRANSILITFHHDPSHDGAASALALCRVLKNLGKKVEVVAPGWKPPAEIKFLPEIDSVKSGLEDLQKFIIELPVHETPVKELSYEVQNGKLVISLVPKTGTWHPDHVESRAGEYRFDLICTVGAPDLKSLGALFHKHADFFYHVPILNIDHDPANEHFGQINHVDINATSNGELIYNLAKKIDHQLIDEHAATCLLAGMITKTKSFKTPNVTPKTLRTASELITRGAKHDKIVHNLYRTRTVSMLRLWGRALARLKHDQAGLVWTMLTRQDFVHAGADPEALNGVIDELLVNSPDAQVVLIIYENPKTTDKGIVGMLHAKRPLKALELTKTFGGAGSRDTVAFELKDKNLVEAEPLITKTLKEQLTKLNV